MTQKESVTKVNSPDQYYWIGKSIPKPDSMEKALGDTQYAGDMHMPGMLHARILWSGVPHAIIRGIDTSIAKKVPGVRSVLTAADIPGINRFGLAVSISVYWPTTRCALLSTPLHLWQLRRKRPPKRE